MTPGVGGVAAVPEPAPGSAVPAPTGSRPPGRFGAIGAWVARHPWPVVGAWAALILIAAPLAPRAPGILSAGGFTSNQLESSKAQLVLEQQLGLPPSALVIVIQSETTARAGSPAFESAAARAIANVPHAEHVTGLLPHTLNPHQVSADGSVVYDVVSLDLQPDQSPEALAPVQAALVPQPGIRTYLAGGPAFYGDIQTVSESDLRRSELVSLPLAAIALLLVFGSAVSAAVPLAVGGTAVLLSLAIIFVLASLTPMSIFVLNLTTLLGLGLGVDYSLLMTSRFREELGRRGGGRLPDGRIDREAVESAVAVTVASAGRAVFFSGLTVLLGLAGLVLFEFMILRSVGAAGAIVVGLDVAASMTLLPALLTIAGPRIDALAVRRLRHRDPDAGESGWGRLARWVMARPVRVFVPTLALLVLFGVPFLHARFNAPDASILPESVPSRQAYDLLVREFGPGEFDPLLLAIHTTGPVTSPANVGKLYDWSRRIAADPRVVRVQGIVDLDPRLGKAQYELLYSTPGGPPDRFAATQLQATTRGDLTTFSVYTPYDPNRSAFRALVDELRSPSSALAPPPGITVQVAGGAADVADVVGAVAAEFPRTALFLVITTYLVLFLLLRSVVLPLKALVMNSLSIVASFGALVWIFQDGNLSKVLGFQPLGFVETTQPVILFCVLFGLSMDYEVFLLSRMKEVYDRTGDNREAVARGLERSGRIVTSAALIVVVVAGSFCVRRHRADQGTRPGRRHRRGPRRDRGPRAARARHDAAPGRLELVDPAPPGALGRVAPPAHRGRDDPPGGGPDAGGGPRAGSLLSGRPRARHRPDAAAGGPHGVPVAVAGARSAADRVPEGRGSARSPDRVVVLHRTPAGGRRPSLRVRVRDLPGGARVVPGLVGVAPGPDRRDGPHVRVRPALGDRSTGRPGRLQGTDPERRPATDSRRAAACAAAGDRAGGRLPARDLGAGERPGPAGSSAGACRGVAGRGASSPGAVSPGAVSPAVGLSPAAPSATSGSPWLMAGIGGHDLISATSAEAGFSIQLRLDAGGRPPVLHGQAGWIDFGAAGGSYYYSRTRMAAQGTLTVGGRQLTVAGEAWFDHQWGDFIAVGAGGWDWFAVNLADGTDLTLSLVRDRTGGYPLVYGTLVHADGTYEHLVGSAFTVTVTAHWTSPETGATYPAGWTIRVPSQDLTISLRPTVANQELDTLATTGVVYWEGSQVVTAQRGGHALGGEAYVELTGYGPSGTTGPAATAPPVP